MATRLLRGEEDTGRWQLTLAGGTRPSRATLATGAALGAAVAVLFAGTTLDHRARRDAIPMIGFGVGRDGPLRAAASPYRRRPSWRSGWSRRRSADRAASRPGSAWRSSVSRSSADDRRLRSDDEVAAVADSVRVDRADATVHRQQLVAARRWRWSPSRSSWPSRCTCRRAATRATVCWRSRDVAPPREFGLGSLFGFAVRRETAVLVAWCVGAALASFAFGIVAKIATGSIPSSVGDMLAQLRRAGTRSCASSSASRSCSWRQWWRCSRRARSAPSPKRRRSGGWSRCCRGGTPRTSVLVEPARLRPRAAVVVTAFVAGVGAWLGAMTQGVDPGIRDHGRRRSQRRAHRAGRVSDSAHLSSRSNREQRRTPCTRS